MKHLILIIALFAFTFVSCDKSQAPTEPQNTTTALLKAESYKDVEIVADLYNECCDEYVSLEGIGHMVVRGNGVHFNIGNVTGSGSSGHTYTVQNQLVENFTLVLAKGASELSDVFNIILTNEDGCSFKLQIHVHITVNAKGEFTVIIEKYEAKCL